jgi:GDP-D-mannose dehydratase
MIEISGEKYELPTGTMMWDDGKETIQDYLEHPQLLIQKGKPTHFFAATGDRKSKTWTVAIPMALDE